jgi:hypothetical protein
MQLAAVIPTGLERKRLLANNIEAAVVTTVDLPIEFANAIRACYDRNFLV